ncbi:MAG: hypothetical protein IJO91_05175 [Oscillospiraceae bacterium]|nr:hypothetical protein [Oscillospiraceae bacterium]
MPLKLSDCTGLLSKPKFRRAAVIAGCALMLLIFLSTLIPSEEQVAPPTEDALSIGDSSAIEQSLEQRLEVLLSEIEGVSSPKVMVTLDSTAETVYARDEVPDRESSVVLVGSSSAKTALTESVVLPKVRGAAVVCGGAADPTIREKVVNTVAGVLGIGTSRIYVTN